jgi:hypothetical protein
MPHRRLQGGSVRRRCLCPCRGTFGLTARRAQAAVRQKADWASAAENGGGSLGLPAMKINLILKFRAGGVRQIREANRITFDGKGGLIVYGSQRREERLVLSRIEGLRIEAVNR